MLYLPKNLYKHRALPYIIGSKEWQENRHIGLAGGDEILNEVVDDLKKSDIEDEPGNVSSDAISETSSGQNSMLDEFEGRYQGKDL